MSSLRIAEHGFMDESRNFIGKNILDRHGPPVRSLLSSFAVLDFFIAISTTMI